MLKRLIFLVLILASIHLAHAQEITNYNININIINSNALISYEIETDQSFLSLNLPEDARITDFEGNYSIKNNIITISSVSGKIKLEYVTGSFIESASKNYFTADFKVPFSTESLNVQLILPELAILENAYPSADLDTDGQHIILNWHSQLDANKSLPIFVIYKEKKYNFIPLLIISLILFIVIIYFLFIRKIKPRVKKIKIRRKAKEEKVEHLLDSENAVINALKESKGEMWQKQIQIKTGFSKAKLSRVIRNLEARNLIKKIPLGNTNKIKLK